MGNITLYEALRANGLVLHPEQLAELKFSFFNHLDFNEYDIQVLADEDTVLVAVKVFDDLGDIIDTVDEYGLPDSMYVQPKPVEQFEKIMSKNDFFNIRLPEFSALEVRAA